jgi:hypothetical protein
VSELYATLLLMGVTLSFGGLVATSALQQISLQSGASSAAASSQAAAAGKDLALAFGTVPAPGSGGCRQSYAGFLEGTGYTLALFNYGSRAFAPAEVFDNGTLLAGGPYGAALPGRLTTYSLTLGCSHPSGQEFLLVDASGAVEQIGT